MGGKKNGSQSLFSSPWASGSLKTSNPSLPALQQNKKQYQKPTNITTQTKRLNKTPYKITGNNNNNNIAPTLQEKIPQKFKEQRHRPYKTLQLKKHTEKKPLNILGPSKVTSQQNETVVFAAVWWDKVK